MKKVRIFSIVLFVLSVAVFASFKLYEKVNTDNKPPVITFESEELKLSVKAEEAALLQGVTAEDNRSGDLSDQVLVEKVSSFVGDGVRVVTYAVADEYGNVTKKERNLQYTDYKDPEILLTRELTFALGENVDVLEYVKAQSVLDGDLTDRIKYTMETAIDTTIAGTYPVEFSVMDSAGKTVYLAVEVKIVNPVVN